MVELSLDAVAFNHDPANSSQSALNIRKNAKAPIPLPEWVKNRASQSPAAYSIANADIRDIFVVASITRLSPSVTHARVRARERFINDEGLNRSTLRGPTPTGMPPALEWNPLGSLVETDVLFAHGDTAECRLPIDRHRLARAGVGIGLIEWRWEYSLDGGANWIRFETTTHRVYCTLSDPTDPWKPQPFDPTNTSMPWTDVLDYACRWAFRATSAQAAATACTRAIYGLGMDVLSYDGGIQSFTESGGTPYFDCALFLEALRRPDASRFNCSDAATVLSTFVNILGGDFLQVQFDRLARRRDRIELNPVLPIGHRYSWPKGATFGFHETAVDVRSRLPRVFDACVVFEFRSRLLEAIVLEVHEYLRYLAASNLADCGEVERVRRPLLGPDNDDVRAKLQELSRAFNGTLVSAHWIHEGGNIRAALGRWETPDGSGLLLDLTQADRDWTDHYVEAFLEDLSSLEWTPVPSVADDAYESKVANGVVLRRGTLAVFARRPFQTGEPVLPIVLQFSSALDQVVL